MRKKIRNSYDDALRLKRPMPVLNSERAFPFRQRYPVEPQRFVTNTLIWRNRVTV